VPKIYNSESEVAEYLKHKSWYLEYKITDSEIIENENLLDMIVQKFMLMKDFNHFLNRALADFEMPKGWKTDDKIDSTISTRYYLSFNRYSSNDKEQN